MIDLAGPTMSKVKPIADESDDEKRIIAEKVAVTVEHVGGLDQSMDQRFGRAPAFLIVDLETEEVVFSENNPAVNAAHGAGTSAAAAMRQHGVKGVISGHFGPKAYQALAAMHIDMWVAPKGLTAAQALERFRGGKLAQATLLEFR